MNKNIIEAPMGEKDIRSQGIKIYRINRGSDIFILLVDVSKVDKELAYYYGAFTEPGVMLGMMKASKTGNEIYQVKNTAAKKKYGPFLYDALMKTVFPNWITSDDFVSPHAINVWKVYYDQRNDVEKKSLADLQVHPSPKMYSIKNHIEPLKHAYRLPGFIKFSPLKELAQYVDEEVPQLEENLIIAAMEIFSNVYDGNAVIAEAAKTYDEVLGSGYSVVGADDLSNSKKKIIAVIDEKKVTNNQEEQYGLMAPGAIIGLIRLQDVTSTADSNKQLYTVDIVAARKGYGPFLYDIGMKFVYPAFVTSDLVVSDDAKKIWRYYLNKRKDVRKVSLKDLDATEFFNEKVEPILPMAFAYQQRGKVNIKHIDNIAETLNIDPKTFQITFNKAAVERFKQVYLDDAVLEEAMKTIRDAADNQLSLFYTKSDEPSVYLFDGKALLKDLESLLATKDVNSIRVIPSSLVAKHMVAYVDLVKVGKILTVLMAAAKGKYGPLAYDIALEVSYPRWLTSSHHIEPGAVKVWDFYLDNRDDVENMKLLDMPAAEEIYNKKKVKSLEGGTMYAFKKAPTGLVKKLIDSTEKFLEDFEELTGFDKRGAYQLIQAGASKFFNMKYKTGF